MKRLKKICLVAICLLSLTRADAQTEVTFYTSMGKFEVMLTDTLTPITVDSFIARVAEKFYDGQIFHRVIDNFMIQGGDPTGTGFGGPGYTIPDEFHPALKNVPKALAMANTGSPNTGGSQFFINLVTNSNLNNKHTVFGMVTTNFTVVQNIGDVPVNANDKPLTDVVLDSVRVTQFPSSVSNLANQIAISIFPNPTRGLFTIDLPVLSTKIEIMNMAGQIVYSVADSGQLEVDFRHQSPGIYVVRASNDESSIETRLILQ